MSDSDSDDSLLGETTFTSRSSSRVESNKKISLKSKFEALEAEATERMDKRIKVAQEMQQQTVTAQEERVTLTDSQLKDLEATLETAGQRRDRLREEEEEEEKVRRARGRRRLWQGNQAGMSHPCPPLPPSPPTLSSILSTLEGPQCLAAAPSSLP
jgi:hypothetical protein